MPINKRFQRSALGLSRAQQAVGDLAALGHSNDEIAKKLGCTATAVNVNLGRAYIALGITGWGNPRVRLVLALRGSVEDVATGGKV